MIVSFAPLCETWFDMLKLTIRPVVTAAAFFSIFSMAHAGEAPPDEAALHLLAPFSTLGGSPEGKAALAGNLAVTEQIQNGSAKQFLLQDDKTQQEQALRDAFITSDNARELADGLGTELGGIYQSGTAYTNEAHPHGSNISPALAALFHIAGEQEKAAAGSAKFFFADGTADGKACALKEVHDVLDPIRGKVDVFGTAYSHDAGDAVPCADNQRAPIDTDANACTKSTDKFGNSRPFQTEPGLVAYVGTDYFGAPSTNLFFLCGPMQPLQKSPSFPSGHTTYGYADALLLALLVPQRYPQMIVRAAEYGNDRIVLGAHYAMDVLGGRTLALYEIARLLDPKTSAAAGQTDFKGTLARARNDLTQFFLKHCKEKTLAACAAADHGRFSDAAADEKFYEATRTYGLPPVYPAKDKEDVSKLTPNPGYLLTTAFPKLTLEQADKILTETEGPSGGFLDNGEFGAYSRLDLYKAAKEAQESENKP